MSPLRALGPIALLLTLGACEQAMQDMYDQPKYRPFAPSDLFPDGMAARPFPHGTRAARAGTIAGTSSGRRGEVPPPARAVAVVPLGADGQPLAAAARQLPVPAAQRPLIDAALLARGRERYTIYCVPCHGVLGDGRGIVPQRGFPNPPSYHTTRLRQAADQHFYDVISAGYGVMYGYASRVPPRDRWAITAYIRALQLSRHLPVQQLSADEMRRLEGSDGS